jgi:hypothetical protein
MAIGSAALASRALSGDAFVAKVFCAALSLPIYASSTAEIKYEMGARCTPFYSKLSYTPIVHTLGNHIIGSGAKDIYPSRTTAEAVITPLLSIATNQYASPTSYTATSTPLLTPSTLVENNIASLEAIIIPENISATLIESVEFETLAATSLPFYAATTAVVPTINYHQ